MKKAIIFILSALMFMSGCSGKRKSDKIQVYTSFSGMYDFADLIAGDTADIYNLIPPSGDAHDYEPTVDDIKNLLEADVFIYNGNGLEHWADDLIETVSDGDALIVEASAGTNPQNLSDPHIWLDPDIALKEMENIKNALVKADKKNAEIYEENYNNCVLKMNSLKDRYSSFNGDGKSIIVTHAAYSYLFDRLNITQHSIEGISGHSDPTPIQMAQIIDYMKENKIKHIFAQRNESSKIAETVASETRATVLSLTPFGGFDGLDYFTAMEENLKALSEAIKQ